MEKSLKQMKDKYGKQIKEMMRQHSQELQKVGLIWKILSLIYATKCFFRAIFLALGKC